MSWSAMCSCAQGSQIVSDGWEEREGEEGGTGPWRKEDCHFPTLTTSLPTASLFPPLPAHTFRPPPFRTPPPVALSVEMALNASAELAAAGAYGAYVRSLQVPGASSPTPTLDIARATGLWQRASSASLGVSGFAGFSATCWFVGRDLFNALGGAVPVGIIESSVGGTAIRQWAPRAALARCPQPYTAPAPYGTAPYAHSQHWNAMVAGLTTGPTTIASIVWDQAESDSFPQSPPGYYGCQTTAQINAWRSAWRAPALPWVFVHLQPYTGAAYLEQLRAAQLEALTLPAVGVASAVDLGDVASPFGNVHFRDKQTIARRIVGALLALVPDAASSYPPPAFLDSSVFWVSATGAAEVDVVFDAGGTGGASGGALALVPSVCPAAVPVLNCSEFQILGNDTAAYAATASLNGNTLTLSASLPSWVYPVGSSYAWAAWPLASLFADGGPAGALPILPWRQALMLAGPPGPRE